MSTNVNRHYVMRDISIVIMSLFLALLLEQTGTIRIVISDYDWQNLLGIFLAGLCFVSVFTTAPAIVLLAEFAKTYPLTEVALVGALGAMVGDFFVFRFIKSHFSHFLTNLIRGFHSRRLTAASRSPIFKIFDVIIGGLIIASPLPDELGLLFMGLTKVSNYVFVPLSFFFNFLGILAIGLLANGL